MSELLDNDLPQTALEALVRAEGEQKRLTERLAAANERVAAAELNERLRDVAAEIGVPTGALPDFLNRGRAQLRMKDGKPAGEHGEFVNLRVWASDLRTQAPHLFEGAPSSAAVPEAPKPQASVLRGNVKRAVFDGLSGKDKHAVIDSIRAGRAQLVD